MARPPLTARQRAELDETQRRQILGGLAACITNGSYASTRIVDVATAAKVSKTTVYAHFDDKEDIFAALYESVADGLLEMVRAADRAAAEAGLPWRERVAAGAAANIDGTLLNPALARSMLVEVQAGSPRMLELRRISFNELADLLQQIGHELAATEPEVRVPPRELTVAALGGLRELALQGIEVEGEPDREAMIASATDFLIGLMRVDPGQPS
jgi:AcrR family transcriptional regulator